MDQPILCSGEGHRVSSLRESQGQDETHVWPIPRARWLAEHGWGMQNPLLACLPFLHRRAPFWESHSGRQLYSCVKRKRIVNWKWELCVEQLSGCTVTQHLDCSGLDVFPRAHRPAQVHPLSPSEYPHRLSGHRGAGLQLEPAAWGRGKGHSGEGRVTHLFRMPGKDQMLARGPSRREDGSVACLEKGLCRGILLVFNLPGASKPMSGEVDHACLQP